MAHSHHTTVWLLKNYSQRILTYYTRILLLDLMLGRTEAHPSPEPKWQLDRFSRLQGSV